MTVYNTERYLNESVNSILNQIYKNFEFIIVDDFSTDKSREILKNYKDKKIKLFLLKKHIGRTSALNFGLKRCKGKFIAILDSDDISSKERLLKQINFLKKNTNIHMIGTNTVLIDEKGKKIKNFYIPKDNKKFNKEMIFNNYLPHSSVMFRKNFLSKIGHYYPKDYTYSQDYALMLKFLKKSKIYVLPFNLTKARVLKNNMSNSKKLKIIREIDIIKNNLFSLKNFDLTISEKLFLKYLITKRVLKIFYKSIF